MFLKYPKSLSSFGCFINFEYLKVIFFICYETSNYYWQFKKSNDGGYFSFEFVTLVVISFDFSEYTQAINPEDLTEGEYFRILQK